MSFTKRSRRFLGARGAVFAVIAGALALGTSTAAYAAGGNAPLPSYPALTTLNLGSDSCITDDVIMNDPITSPIQVTYGSDGSPVVNSHATPPVTYDIWYLKAPGNTWVSGPPPGTQLNPNDGVLSAYGPPSVPALVASPLPEVLSSSPAAPGSVTYTVRVHGKDAVGAKGTEQFQINVDDGATVSVTYEGNDFDNANAELTIQLNASSTDSTALTLAPVLSSLGIPGSAPVTFSLVNSPGWHLGSNNVLTGANASDPEFKAITTGNGPGSGPFDVVFFTLSGISTDAGGVFFTNTDVNPCVSIQNSTPQPPPPPPPVTTSSYGDYVNGFGNGWDVFRQHAWSGNPIVGWPATQHDPATHFLREAEGGNFRIEYAPNGVGDGLCVSNPGDNALVLRPCNTLMWQQFSESGGYVHSVVNGGFVNPDGTGNQLTVGGSPTPWGGSKYQWESFSSLPA